MLYEMVMGRPPYEGTIPMAVALMHVQAPLPIPRDINPALSEMMERVLVRALEKEPADRYASAVELAKNLEAVVQAETPTEPHLPRLLTELASTVASTKGSEDLTVDVRAEIRRLDTTERHQRVMRLVPGFLSVAVIAGLVIALAFSLNETSRERQAAEQTATAINGLFVQLGNAQTAAALGNRVELEPTVLVLQTNVAAALTAGAPAPNTNTIAPPTPTHTTSATATILPTLTNTATFTPSRTTTRAAPAAPVTFTPAATLAPTPTSRPGDTPIPNPTSTQGVLPTESPTKTHTPTLTFTPLPPPTSTPTATPLPSSTHTPLPTITPGGSTPTRTITPIPTTPCPDGC